MKVEDELKYITEYLRNVSDESTRSEQADTDVRKKLSDKKIYAVGQNDQKTAKLIWCYEQILKIQSTYLSAYSTMKNENYYDAWCLLERIEIEINFLEPHFILDSDNDAYKINFIKKHVKQFQSLYPYAAFTSPAWLQLEKVCTICRKPISIWKSCGHIKGEIYDGQLCAHEITKVELLEVSVVTNPLQKYSVLFLVNSETGEQVDHYNYDLVKYVIRGLQDPFECWDVQRTKIRQPHSLFLHVGRNDNCPCGSGKKYQDCCLLESGVLRPHVEIRFSVPPPDDLPRMVYPDYSDISTNKK